METLSEKEREFVEKLKQRKIVPAKLEKNLKIAIFICYAFWIGLLISAMLITFLIGEQPKVYHVLALLSLVFVSLGLYLNFKNTLKVLSKIEN